MEDNDFWAIIKLSTIGLGFLIYFTHGFEIAIIFFLAMLLALAPNPD